MPSTPAETTTKTPEEVLAAHWDVYDRPDGEQPSGCFCGFKYQLGRPMQSHRIDLLRAAGLLIEMPDVPVYGKWQNPHALTLSDADRFAVVMGSHFNGDQMNKVHGHKVVQSVLMWLADNDYRIVKNEPSLSETSPALIELLLKAADQYGATGVARTAAQLVETKNWQCFEFGCVLPNHHAPGHKDDIGCTWIA